MKKICIFLLISMIPLIMVGCSSNDYANSSNWMATDEEFVEDYFHYYMTEISVLANQHNIDLDENFNYIDNKGFRIIYKNDDVLIEFYFYNDSGGFGKFRSDYLYFNENIEKLFNYSKHKKIIMFITDVNSLVSFDYQGGEEKYHELYLSYLAHKENTYYYHHDSVVGSIGYWVKWQNKYSEKDTRSYISFEYYSLLKPIDN